MASEPAALWFVPAEGTDSHAILLKCPTNILKAITQGCPVKIIFGVREIADSRILCTATKIFDDPTSPYIISGAQICHEEHLALSDILKRNSTPLFLFDELCRCVSWAEIALDPVNVAEVKNLVGEIDSLYSGAFNNNTSHALDCLDLSVGPDRTFEKAITIPLARVKLSFGQFQHSNLFAIGVHEVHKFNIGDPEEGVGFEQSVWQLLESIFPLQIFKSPQVEENKLTRELTDILCLSQYGIFVFEAKSISVLSTSLERDTERRVKNLHKQIKKALGQLKGAVRSIKAGNKITTQNGVELEFDRSIVPHAVVIVSELLPFGDWEQIVVEAFKIAKDYSSMIHILDLRELTLLVGISGDANIFDYNLMERFKHFVQCRSVFIRAQPPKANSAKQQ